LQQERGNLKSQLPAWKLSKTLWLKLVPTGLPRQNRKRKSLEVPAAIGITPYKRQQARGEEAFAGLDQESTMYLVVEMVLGLLDSDLDQTSLALVKLLDDVDDSTSMHDMTAKILEHRVKTNKRLLGSKPSGLSQELDAPSTLDTLSAIASKMKKKWPIPRQTKESRNYSHSSSQRNSTKVSGQKFGTRRKCRQCE
jgi:hypothetical protein